MNEDDAIRLPGGDRLPRLGLGFWKVPIGRCASLVGEAIDVGYRHLDCASDYGNEAETGEGIAAALATGACTRDDLWVTSKLWNTCHRPEHVRLACERSLSDLRLDYLDLYLIHFPISLRFVPFEQRYPAEWVHDPDSPRPVMEPDPVPIAQTWLAMEALKREGLVRHIGVCNFGVSLLRDLLSYAKAPPSVLQVESHPLLTQTDLLRFCHESEIAFTAFSPLGAQSYVELAMAGPDDSLLDAEVIRRVADAHEKSPGQVLLRWGVQRDASVVMKTGKRERLVENLAVFDFELTDDEMRAITALNQNRRFNDPGRFCEAAFNTFFPIYD